MTIKTLNPFRASRTSTVLAVGLLAALGMAFTSSEVRAEQAVYYLVVVNNTNSNIYFSDYTQWRRPGDLINTWNDVDSVYNNEFIGNDPDYLAPGEVSNQCGELPFHEILTEDCEAWYLDTFSRYDGHLGSGYDPWAEGNSMDDIDSKRLYLPGPFFIVNGLAAADFQWRIQYGCGSGSNNEDNWPESQTFSWQSATFYSEFHDKDFPWSDYWEHHTLVVAIINDCNGSVTWANNYWDGAAAAPQYSDGSWSGWINVIDGETDPDGDSEPIGCAEPLDIQCKLITGEEYLDRQPTMTTDTYSCDPFTGFTCLHGEQADGSCGDWEVRYFCGDDAEETWAEPVRIHAGWNTDVCLNVMGTPQSGANINTYHCDWIPETWIYGSDMKIHYAPDPDLCLNVSGTNYWGGNINLYDCDYAEEFFFADGQLRTLDRPEFCVNVYQSGIPWDQDPTSMWGAAGVNIYHCDWTIDSWVAIAP